MPTKWLRHSFKVRFSHFSVFYSPPLLNVLNRDKDRKFTRIYHQSLNLQHFFLEMHHSTHGNSDGHHWYADFIILCFLMTHFKDLSQAHSIVYFKKYNSKIPTFTPSLLNQNIESLSTMCRLQENKMLQKMATTGRQPVYFTWIC